MNFEPVGLAGAWVISVDRKCDERGWFSRTYSKDEFAQIGFSKEWLQHNHTYTITKGSIRGMHYQQLPFAETKLVRCVSGAVYDVIVDLRYGSPTYLHWQAVELSADNGKMLLIPEGFAHGFQTIKEDTGLVYCHSEKYQPGYEAGLYYADPSLNIQWPLPVSVISERDMSHPLITEDFRGINLAI